MNTLPRALALILIGLTLAGCGAADRLKNVGREPSLSAIDNPTAKAGYRPVQMPMPQPEPVHFNSNSLWRTGSRAFFKDQRAARVGDILTVRVKIADKAEIDNKTERRRSNNEKMGVSNLFGLENNIAKVPMDPSSLVNAGSTSSSSGQGSVEREEAVTTNIAAVVTQLLPNGNMVIEGRQEIRVNFEIRELIVAGIVRPEDIQSDNIVDSNKIAEARIAYGGRGQISDVQQPRYGQQVMDIVLPF